MARPTRSRTRNISLGPLVQHKPPSPRPGRNHTATSRKQTHNNTKESGLKNSTQNPGLDSAVPPCLWRLWWLSGLRGSSGLELSAWVVFRVGSLWRLLLWFLRNVARNSPTCISNIEIASLEFCGFLDTYEKLGYPNYVRVLVDEAPKANSCVRSSFHDTAHDPRDASNTTPTPHNAKSRFASWRARHATQRGAASSRMRTRRAPASSMTVTRRAIQRRSTPASHAARMGFASATS